MRRRGGRPFTSRNLAGNSGDRAGEVQAVEPLSAGSVALVDAFGQCSSVGEANWKVIKGIFGSHSATGRKGVEVVSHPVERGPDLAPESDDLEPLAAPGIFDRRSREDVVA